LSRKEQLLDNQSPQTTVLQSKERGLRNALRDLLDLPEQEKEARGLQFTPQEINQQPASWKQTYLRCLQLRLELRSFLKESGIGGKDSPAPIVFLVGAGTSDYIGRAIADLLRQRWRCIAWAVPSTDLLTNMETLAALSPRHLWISFSRSGESSEGVAVLEKALAAHPQVRHLVVTCNAAGRMAQLCVQNPRSMRAIVLDDAVNDRGLAMTSSFSNMVVAGQCLSHLEELELYGKTVDAMATIGEKFLPEAAAIAANLATRRFSRSCFLGIGPLAAVANESALKLLELSAGKIQTMSESTLGFRHGPMSALDQNTLLTHFISNDSHRQGYDFDLLREVRAKKLAGVTVAVTPQRSAELDGLADHVISLDLPPQFKDEYRPALDVMFAQSLGLFSSLHLGLRPDHPSPNGAINRVVSHLRIYP
jgi:tagatose-6-phosphate ketose/aldose isomerase